MKIYNSLTNKKEEFKPLEEGKVKMYACGITVYDLSHIGHARQAITYSMISEYLKYRGYDVKYVRNYTDVDDKIIARAALRGMTALELSAEQIRESEKDMAALHVKDPDVYTKASEYIDKIIDFVQKLIDKGYAYAADNGDVYYSVRKFKEYGKLSNRKIDELLNGVRKDVEEGKRDPLDFALWKAAKPGEVSWSSPWGEGRPGWHIECSVMALDTLGEQIDIHGGGKDLIFPHHENEVAQSEALTGKQFASVWSHCGLIKINGEKMSKSLGNSLTIRDAVAKYNYEAIKFMFFRNHYTSDIDINDQDFELAEKQLYYFYNTIVDVKEYIAKYKTEEQGMLDVEFVNGIKTKFVDAMDDDFNTTIVTADLFEIFKYLNNSMMQKGNKALIANTLEAILNNVYEIYGIIGLFEQIPEDYISELKAKHLRKLNVNIEEIKSAIDTRNEYKANKDYENADKVRNDLLEKGIVLKDTREGTKWDIASLN